MFVNSNDLHNYIGIMHLDNSVSGLIGQSTRGYGSDQCKTVGVMIELCEAIDS